MRDAKTGMATIYETPIRNSRPRRGRVDEQNRLWFAEYGGNAIALFDQVPGITDLNSPTQSDYRTVVLQAEAALNSGWGVHWTGRAVSFQPPQYPSAKK